jgi:uncharacterized SAM-binding protein YcdF (DUF218 family)
VYRARLDHAFELFKRGIAPVVIATGGAGDDLHFTEGGVGHDYLMHRGIAEPNLIAETQGSDTAQSAERVGVIMRANHMHSCIAVSDEYHVFRIQTVGEQSESNVAPVRFTSVQIWQRGLAVLREAVSWRAVYSGMSFQSSFVSETETRNKKLRLATISSSSSISKCAT